MKRVVLAALLSMSVCFAVRAEGAADEANKEAVLEEARQHVAKAKVHYDLGEFKQAAEEYTLVYRLRPIPALLFNIAQAYRQAGLYEKAKSFYRSYLREVPNAKNKGSIEASIREMDQLLAKEKKTREAPPSGVKEPAEASLPIKKPEQKPAAVPPTWAAKQGTADKSPAAKAQPGAPEKTAAAPEKTAAAAPEKPATAPGQPTGAKVAVATTPAQASSPWTAPHQTPRAPLGATSRIPAPQVHSSSHTATWIAAGAAGVALAAGGVFGAKTLSSRSQDDASKANLLYGIGGGLALVSGALFLMNF